jgi:hypothetical protein
LPLPPARATGAATATLVLALDSAAAAATAGITPATARAATVDQRSLTRCARAAAAAIVAPTAGAREPLALSAAAAAARVLVAVLGPLAAAAGTHAGAAAAGAVAAELARALTGPVDNDDADATTDIPDAAAAAAGTVAGTAAGTVPGAAPGAGELARATAAALWHLCAGAVGALYPAISLTGSGSSVSTSRRDAVAVAAPALAPDLLPLSSVPASVTDEARAAASAEGATDDADAEAAAAREGAVVYATEFGAALFSILRLSAAVPGAATAPGQVAAAASSALMPLSVLVPAPLRAALARVVLTAAAVGSDRLALAFVRALPLVVSAPDIAPAAAAAETLALPGSLQFLAQPVPRVPPAADADADADAADGQGLGLGAPRLRDAAARVLTRLLAAPAGAWHRSAKLRWTLAYALAAVLHTEDGGNTGAAAVAADPAAAAAAATALLAHITSPPDAGAGASGTVTAATMATTTVPEIQYKVRVAALSALTAAGAALLGGAAAGTIAAAEVAPGVRAALAVSRAELETVLSLGRGLAVKGDEATYQASLKAQLAAADAVWRTL